MTPELKEYEARVLGAEERMAAREAELFGAAARARSGRAIARIQRTARRARPARRVDRRSPRWRSPDRYVRPEVHDGFDLDARARAGIR